jgi:hypothetical protein
MILLPMFWKVVRAGSSLTEYVWAARPEPDRRGSNARPRRDLRAVVTAPFGGDNLSSPEQTPSAFPVARLGGLISRERLAEPPELRSRDQRALTEFHRAQLATVEQLMELGGTTTDLLAGLNAAVILVVLVAFVVFVVWITHVRSHL